MASLRVDVSQAELDSELQVLETIDSDNIIVTPLMITFKFGES